MGRKQLEESSKTQKSQINVNSDYKTKYGFNVKVDYKNKPEKGISERVISSISAMKEEQEWMHEFRQNAFKVFESKPTPQWGGDLNQIDYDNIYYYLKPTDQEERSWSDVPEKMKETFDRLGVPQAEQQHLAGIKAQFDSEVIYGSLLKELEEEGVIFMGTDEALKKHPEFFEEYFGKVVPPGDNKFAALNSAVWSGGSFVYVPKGVKVKRPLQAYFRINAQNMGQFERTLIIADEGSEFHYVEGCFTAGHLINTKEGLKKIEDVAVDDEVLTHSGLYKKVYNTQKRPYNGDLFSIKVWGIADSVIEATEEHPFLSVSRVRKNEKNANFSGATWTPANSLKKGDYLVVPIDPTEDTSRSKDFRIRYKNEMITFNVPLTPEFFRLIGYYLAEGSVDERGYLKFSFHVKEREYIEDVKAAIEQVFGHNEFHEFTHKNSKGLELVFSSAKLARVFAQFGTSSSTKAVPQWVMQAKKVHQAELIKCYFRGDGNYYNKILKHGEKEIIRINTVSRMLALQTRDVLLRLGIVSTINTRDRSKESRQTMYSVCISGSFIAEFGEIIGKKLRSEISGHKRASMFFIQDKYAYFPIRSVNRTYVDNIDVYNFSVEQDESYVCNGVTVHNCTAPVYASDSLHAAVVEIIVKPGARCRYTTIQNWSTNVYNLVTKRARVEKNGIMEWIDGNLGSKLTMKYPSCYLVGEGAHGEVLSIAYASEGQHQDAGAKMMHIASNTTSTIISKSISVNGGRTSYRGLVSVSPHAKNAKSRVECDALILDSESASDTFPVMRIDNASAQIEHEATVSKIGEEKLFYLMSRGLSESEAMSLVVSGFIEPIVKELPMEYSVELNRLIELEMEGSVG